MSSAKKYDVKVNIIPKKSKSAENDLKSLNIPVEKNNEKNDGPSISILDNNELELGGFVNSESQETASSEEGSVNVVIKSSKKVPKIPDFSEELITEPGIEGDTGQQTIVSTGIPEDYLKKKEEKIDNYLPELELFYKYDKERAKQDISNNEGMNMANKDFNPVKNTTKDTTVLFDVNNLDLSALNTTVLNAAEVKTPAIVNSEITPADEIILSKKQKKEQEKIKKLEEERLAKEKEIEDKRLQKEKKMLEKQQKKSKKKGDSDNVINDEGMKAKSFKEVKAQSKNLGYMLSNGEKIYRSYKYNGSKFERIDVTNKRLVCVNTGYQEIEINEVVGLSSKFKRETKASFILFGLLLVFIAAAGAAIALGYIPLNQASWMFPKGKNWLKILIFVGSGLFALTGLILLFRCSRKDFYINIFTRPQEMFFAIKSHSTPKFKIDDNVLSVKANKEAYLVVAELGAAILNIKEYNKRQEKKQ